MKRYEKPVMVVSEFKSEDFITVSGGGLKINNFTEGENKITYNGINF